MAEKDTGTREALLRAGTAEFAAHGFARATVRGICARAGANVAAVNYHFGSKGGLYAAVLDRIFRETPGRPRPAAAVAAAGSDPAESLRAFIRAFAVSVYEQGGEEEACELGAIFLSEMARPSPHLDTLIEKYVRADALALRAVVAELLGPAASKERIEACSMSVVGQVLYYALAWPIAVRLNPGHPDVTSFLDRFVDHVASFSLAGIAAVRRAGESEVRK